MTNDYRICTRCIMDTTDPDIQFDENGVCNHCKGYDDSARSLLRPDAAGQQELERVVSEIKARGKGKDHDCIIGVSGGVDSSFVAYMVKQLGLRPLVVSMDNGWDSELAVSNVEKVAKWLDTEVHKCVLEWEEFKDLQLSFLRASVSDAEIPTDHAIGAVLYRTAMQNDISYIISGSNMVTEGILPGSWTYGIWDWKYIRSVHQGFGKTELRNFPHYSMLDSLYYTSVKKIKTVRILNYQPYVKKEAMHILEAELDWEYYGGKHYESIYTRFLQGYILPRKFNIDKRKAHLSTLICSGQTTRAEALEEMKRAPYPEEMQQEDRVYVIKKLGLTEAEFEEIMSLPVRTHADYPNSERFRRSIKGLVRTAQKLRLLPRDLGGI